MKSRLPCRAPCGSRSAGTPASALLALLGALAICSPAAHAVAPPRLTRLADLPLHEVPAAPVSGAMIPDSFAVLLTGDGGWATLAREVSGELAAAGVPVVALNSLKYFWKARDPDAAAADLAQIITAYGTRWRRQRVLLIGYSFGADVLPFLYRRLPAAMRGAVESVTLLAPARTTDLEFHFSGWLPLPESGARAVLPEIEAMGAARVLCLHGDGDGDTPCDEARLRGLRTMVLPGGHHFDGEFAGLAERILQFPMEQPAIRPGRSP